MLKKLILTTMLVGVCCVVSAQGYNQGACVEF